MQNIKITPKNVNELFGPPEKRSFLALSILLVYMFRIDALQKTMKIEKYANELSGLPEKCSFLTLSTLLETLHVFGKLMPSKKP